MLKTICILASWLICVNFLELKGQQALVVFYNVENLFDTRDDSLTHDEEFLPGAEKNWTNERMRRKLVRIYQTLAAAGKGEAPALIGLCEIENRYVLDRLIYDTPLNRFPYRVIHRESPDARGVDVALLYRTDLFEPDSTSWLRVPLPGNEQTREILMVRGRLWKSETVYFYVNHWPSRYGGAGSSNPKRMAAAGMLAVSVLQVMKTDSLANVVIMGDFNDEPGDESLLSINKILQYDSPDTMFSLVNLSAKSSLADFGGTIKHQGVWSVFDQVIVSPAIIYGMNGCWLPGGKADIFRAGFLLEPDESYSGSRPFRTYMGPGYHDGFSDHLPVSILIGKRTATD
ncbi:MAG: endonuclease [Bacteroidales bacterium]|nr:endonuclease [Bacteroidales bacterium]